MMKTQYRFLTALLFSHFIATASFSAAPEWSDETIELQQKWGSLQDTDSTLPIPNLYPYAECAIGKKQSPVNITTPATVTALNAIKTKYVSSPLIVENNGHTLKFNTPITDNGNFFFIGREKFELLQFHFHTPSEHTINGNSYPLEIHFVHTTPSGKVAVLGVFAKVGSHNPAFQTILDNAPSDISINTVSDSSFDPLTILPKTRNVFYSYHGSITSPPCSEGVQWHILKNVIEISQEQFEHYKMFYDENHRITQPLNGRVVEVSH